MTYIPPQGSGDLRADVWGTPKVSQVLTLWNYTPTFNLDPYVWTVTEGGDSSVGVVDGGVVIDAGTTGAAVAALESRRHPRYQPNRGHVFSTASQGFVAGDYELRFGLFSEHDGVFFRYDSDTGQLYGVVRTTTGVVANDLHTTGYGTATTTDTELEIAAADLEPVFREVNAQRAAASPPLAAISTVAELMAVNLLWDIRFQWRGAGDVFYYVNRRLVSRARRLGVAAAISFSNPALPCVVEVTAGAAPSNELCRFGCFEIGSEGAREERYKPITAAGAVVNAGNGTETPIVAARVGSYLKGMDNTRDVRIFGSSGSVTDTGRGLCRLYKGGTVTTSGPGYEIPDTESGLEVCAAANIASYSSVGAVLLGTFYVEQNDQGTLTLADFIEAWLTRDSATVADNEPLVLTVEGISGTPSVNAVLTLGEQI